MKQRYRYLVVVMIILASLVFAANYYTSDSNKISLKYNYQQLSLFNHTLHNYSFTYSGDERDDNGNFSKMITSINSNYPNITFNLNGGDLRSNSNQLTSFQNDYLSGGFNHFNKPVLFVIGNHELINNPSESIYISIFGTPTYYNFTENNSYFIIIDNADGKTLNSTQLSWLKDQLTQSQKYKYRFIFMHIPLYTVNGETETSMPSTGSGGANELRDMFDSNNITMIFASHIHNYYTGTWGKTPFIISGGAGAPPEENHTPFHHYIVINITDNSVNYSTVTY